MAKRKAKVDHAQVMTDQIIDLIEGGLVGGKWIRPWKCVGGFMPYNVLTGKAYRGINVLLGIIQGGGAFGTYKQWGEVGGQIQGGQKACTYMIAPMNIERKDAAGNPVVNASGDVDTFRMFRAFGVFNAQQQQGWTPEQADAVAFDDVEGAEQTIPPAMTASRCPLARRSARQQATTAPCCMSLSIGQDTPVASTVT